MNATQLDTYERALVADDHARHRGDLLTEPTFDCWHACCDHRTEPGHHHDGPPVECRDCHADEPCEDDDARWAR